ncbi:helix-turn-helix transcriptional regulator [Methanosarcina barkeri]|uniref:DUF7343 domain-containing protein n=1 Tax=Methanosarcina barkeri 227 TaxID=1434106 RepID=A0A0E3R0S7_METBA|nr:hypothetical protein [Methanosarcina barkeri]AKB57752.1 hypothetical protein MSBR2_1236 [Methanosarcina barkeri 227]
MPGKVENQYTTLGLSKMNIRLYIICIAAVLALAGPALAANNTATVHGAVYGWDTFKPLENAVVEVNSTPSQSMVAKYGLYSFDLVPGDYNITASYYQNSSVTYTASETIQIKDQGKYVRDLLLLPVYSEELMGDSEVNTLSENHNGTAESSSSNTTNSLTDTSTGRTTSKGNSSSMNLADQNITGYINVNYLPIASLLFLILIAAGYRVSRKDKKIEKNQPFRGHQISGTGAVEKSHSTGDFFKPKVPELSVEVHDKRAEVPHESLEPKLKWDSQVQDSQVQESQVKPFETASSTESIADPVKEPVREPVPESLQEHKELINEPVNEQVKPAVTELSSEIPEKKMQKESADIKVDPKENEKELVESELQKEKQGILSEKADDKPTESPETETTASKKKLPLPADLQEVMDIIRGQGGRITQKDLRSKLKYSEGKVSLMLADLERRELIEKFKRGRGNVVILRDEER